MRYEVDYAGSPQYWVVESEVELRAGDIIETERQELRVAERRALGAKMVVGENEYRVTGFRLLCVPVTESR